MTRQSGYLSPLAALVARGEIKALELVERSLARIDAHADLNAVISLRADAALRDAAELDHRVARGEVSGVLAGIPLLVKDSEDVAGMRTTFGSLTHRDAPLSKRDSLAVQRLRAAGAVIVGKSNLSEFAFKAHAFNRLFGATLNPWAPQYSPGGSSGGSAAALAAGLVGIATAADGGGSARIPASCCGLVGMKPTNGVVGRDPIPPWPDFTTDGVMSTTAADTRVLLQVLAGPTAGDPTTQLHVDLDSHRLPTRVLATPRFIPSTPLGPEADRLFQNAVKSIESDLRLPVEWLTEAVFRTGDIDQDWWTIAALEEVHFLGRTFLASNRDALEPAFVRYMDQAVEIGVSDYVEARQRRFAYVRELDDLLGTSTVLVTPTVTVDGWTLDGRLPGSLDPGLPLDAFNVQAQNVTGHPAITIPAGHFATSGIPFGLQVTGPRYSDSLLLSFAASWESIHLWPRVANGYEPFETGWTT